MKRGGRLVLSSVFLFALPVFAGGEIYGTIRTDEGRSYTGPIRWDRNENFWDDRLDAMKHERVKIIEEGFHINVFGFTLGPDQHEIAFSFSVPFGHLSALEVVDGDQARLFLKSGEALMIRASSSDIGRSMRGVTVDDAETGLVELEWDDIVRVDFKANPGEGSDSERLFGTVTTRSSSHQGFLVWDRDESMLADMLDGTDEAGDEREIPLRHVREVQPAGSSASKITLNDGNTLVLRGTNDVGRGHRGIMVRQNDGIDLDIDWDEVVRVVIEEPPPSATYAAFDGGRRLAGTVRMDDGTEHSGLIVWDLDERYTWEAIDASQDGAEVSIPFASIASIRRANSESSEVRLRDGRTMQLYGSNDVNDENRGVRVISSGGDEVVLDWESIELVEFR